MPRDVNPGEIDTLPHKKFTARPTASDTSALETDTSGIPLASSEQSTDVNTCIVLRIECLSKYLLKVGHSSGPKTDISQQ